jgi:hypothetical protein
MKSPSRPSNQLLSAAREYAERGWKVFPLIPRDKKPIIADGFKAASTDRNRVLEWWQSFPDANIGLATGDPFDVLDLDGTNGVPHLRELLGTAYRHTGPVVLTGKGWHFYFEAIGSGNRAGLLGGKVDFRGSGGYVVAPPSVHPSGRVYQWASDGRDGSAALPPVPDRLRDVLVKPKSIAQPHGLRGDYPDGPRIVHLDRAGKTAIERPDIVMVAESLGLAIYPHGAYLKTNCIFHEDPGPSMVLYTGQNKFNCYGCEAHGDSWDLANLRDMTGRVGVRP